jgi:hypothetical protein
LLKAFAKNRRFTASALSLSWATALVASTAAQATLTVAVLSNGGVAPPIAGSTDVVVWYAAQEGTPSGFIMDNDSVTPGPYTYAPIDLTQSQVTEGASFANAIKFDVLSDKAFTSTTGQTLGIAVTVIAGAGSGGARYVPIAGANENFCGSTGCRIGNVVGAGSGDPAGGAGLNQYYFAVPYTPGNHVHISLYPRDICTSYYNQAGGEAAGCIAQSSDGNHHRPILGSTGTNIQLKFTIQVLDASGNFTVNPPAANQDEAAVNLRFEDSARPAVNCPGTTINYYPGDGQIFADTSGFANSTQAAPAGYAPLIAAIAALKLNNGAPVTNATFLTPGVNDHISHIDLGTFVPVGGFNNLTSATDSVNTYGVSFLVQDAAGVVSVPTGVANACQISNVQTSAIQGFLSKSSCFIATAAFRSIDSSPVAMLRQFRDRVLFQSDLGTEFVHWYYRWSPPAAEWLMKNPEYRYPVLQALIPVELVAWFMLHPVYLTALMVFAMSSLILGIGFTILVRMRGRQE